jgi:hypothetical protein
MTCPVRRAAYSAASFSAKSSGKVHTSSELGYQTTTLVMISPFDYYNLRTCDFILLYVSPLGVAWQRRTIRLTRDKLWIGKTNHLDRHGVLDFIPLVEVVRVLDYGHQHHENNGRDNHLKSFKSLIQIGGSAQKPEDDDEDEMGESNNFTILTEQYGVQAGKSTVLKATSAEECHCWVETIEEISQDLRRRRKEDEERATSTIVIYQRKAANLYNSQPIQLGVGAIIVASYVIAMIEKQVLCVCVCVCVFIWLCVSLSLSVCACVRACAHPRTGVHACELQEDQKSSKINILVRPQLLPQEGDDTERNLRIVEWIFTMIFGVVRHDYSTLVSLTASASLPQPLPPSLPLQASGWVILRFVSAAPGVDSQHVWELVLGVFRKWLEHS